MEQALLLEAPGWSRAVQQLTCQAVFQDAPPLPPSPAQASAKAAASTDFLGSMRRICKNLHFVLLLASYTLLVSVYIAITTLLNRAVVQFFPVSLPTETTQQEMNYGSLAWQ